MARKFETALAENALPLRLGDVRLVYDTSLWVGRADRPDRSLLARVGLVVGSAFGAATLAALLTSADHATVGFLLAPCIAGFSGAAWLEQRERRQRAFAVDFAEHILRLDFSTPLSGMARTLYVPFEQVSDVSFGSQGPGLTVLTVDFEAGGALYREVLIASVTPAQAEQGERVRRMLRAAFGLEKPAEEKPGGPPPPVDSFG